MPSLPKSHVNPNDSSFNLILSAVVNPWPVPTVRTNWPTPVGVYVAAVTSNALLPSV